MSIKCSRGALIVFEGLDRSGKTTHCSLLVDRIKNNFKTKTILLKYPNRESQIGKVINDFLQKKETIDDHAIHLLFSANRWEQNDMIRDYLKAGVTCVVDRYVYSGVAFSAIKPGLNLEWCKKPDEGLIRPDRVYFLDVEPDVLAKRVAYGKEIYESLSVQKCVRDMYTKLMINDSVWKCVAATDRSLDEIHNEIYSDTEQLLLELESIPDKFPIKYLWS